MFFRAPESCRFAFLEIERFRSNSNRRAALEYVNHFFSEMAAPLAFLVQLDDRWQEPPRFEPAFQNEQRDFDTVLDHLAAFGGSEWLIGECPSAKVGEVVPT